MDQDPKILSPWRRLVLPLSNPLSNSEILHTRDLKLTIIESGSDALKTPLVGALLVPRGREGDELFCSHEGNIRLLSSFFGVTRLMLVSNETPRAEGSLYAIHPAENDRVKVAEAEGVLMGLLLNYYPEVCLNQPVVQPVRFVTCKEKLLIRKVNSDDIGLQAGRVLVTTELVETDGIKSVRRRLRLDNTHGWLHTDAIMKPVNDNFYMDDDQDFYASLTEQDIVDFDWFAGISSFPEGRHSAAMIRGLSLVSHHFNSNADQRRVLCLGIGDVSTTATLNALLGFSIVAIENDQVLLQAFSSFQYEASSAIHVGLFHYDDLLHELHVPGVKQGEEWDKMRKEDWGKSGFDAIFVDINQPAPVSRSGLCICSPPRNFLCEDTLVAAKGLLRAHGVLILHVVAPDYLFYLDTVKSLQQFVGKVYETRLNESEFVLVATGVDCDATTANEAVDDFFLKTLSDNLVPKFKFVQLSLVT